MRIQNFISIDQLKLWEFPIYVDNLLPKLFIALKKAMKVMKQKQVRTIASDEYEERLKHAERKLKLLENKRETESAPLSDGNLNGSAASVIIRNLPYGMKDAEDCHQMLHDG